MSPPLPLSKKYQKKKKQCSISPKYKRVPTHAHAFRQKILKDEAWRKMSRVESTRFAAMEFRHKCTEKYAFLLPDKDKETKEKREREGCYTENTKTKIYMHGSIYIYVKIDRRIKRLKENNQAD